MPAATGSRQVGPHCGRPHRRARHHSTRSSGRPQRPGRVRRQRAPDHRDRRQRRSTRYGVRPASRLHRDRRRTAHRERQRRSTRGASQCQDRPGQARHATPLPRCALATGLANCLARGSRGQARPLRSTATRRCSRGASLVATSRGATRPARRRRGAARGLDRRGQSALGRRTHRGLPPQRPGLQLDLLARCPRGRRGDRADRGPTGRDGRRRHLGRPNRCRTRRIGPRRQTRRDPGGRMSSRVRRVADDRRSVRRPVPLRPQPPPVRAHPRTRPAVFARRATDGIRRRRAVCPRPGVAGHDGQAVAADRPASGPLSRSPSPYAARAHGSRSPAAPHVLRLAPRRRGRTRPAETP